MPIRSFEEVSEAAEPVLSLLNSRLVDVLKARPDAAVLSRGIRERGGADLAVSRFNIGSTPTLKMLVESSQTGFGGDPDMPIILSAEEAKTLFGDMTEADYRTLCEYGLHKDKTRWEKILASSGDALNAQVAVGVTVRDMYKRLLELAKSSVQFFEDLDPQADVREFIKLEGTR